MADKGSKPIGNSVGAKLQPAPTFPTTPSSQPKTIASIPKAPKQDKRPK